MDIDKQVERLNTEHLDFRRRVEKLEDNDLRHENDIRTLYAANEGTKVYVEQILTKIDALETKLFSAFINTQNNTQKERQGWQELIKYVIGATIGALIIYIFTGR